jgi:GNAT superfamily N-acetyltransferase
MSNGPEDRGAPGGPRIVPEPISRLAEHGEVPIRFTVRCRFEVRGDDPDTAVLVERPVSPAWVKDYDSVPGQRPARWAERWDLRHWGLLAAYGDDRRVGGAVLAHRTSGVHKLEDREDLAGLWDLRVHPEHRQRGIGRALFAAAVDWARQRGCQELRVETQDINVPACRFYQRQGCRLHSIDRTAYREFPDEVELVWSLALTGSGSS